MSFYELVTWMYSFFI